MTSLKSQISEILQQGIEDGIFPGSSVTVFTPESRFCVSEGNYTYVKNSEMISGSTFYDCASLTKVVTGLLFLQAWKDGYLKPEDRLIDHLPEADSCGKDSILLKHLATYTVNLVVPSMTQLLHLQPKEFMQSYFDSELRYSSGSTYLYTNSTPFLLGLAIEKAVGRSLPEYFKETLAHKIDFDFLWGRAKNSPPTEIINGIEIKDIVHDEGSQHILSLHYSGVSGIFSSTEQWSKILAFLMNKSSLENYFGDKISKHIFMYTEIANSYAYSSYVFHEDPTSGFAQSNYLRELSSPNWYTQTGFTGTLLCCNPVEQVGFVMLANSTYPQRKSIEEKHMLQNIRYAIAKSIIICPRE